MRAYVDIWFMAPGEEVARPQEIAARLESLRALAGVRIADRTLDAPDEYLMVVEAADLETLEGVIQNVEKLPNLTVHRVRIARPS